MSFNIRATLAIFALALLASLILPAGNAYAARLVVLESHARSMQDDRVIENPNGQFSRVTPDDIWYSVYYSYEIEVQEDEDPFEDHDWLTQFGQYLIEPDDGESIGDPVCYSYAITRAVETTIAGGGAAVAGAGGADDIVISTDLDPAQASVNMTTGILQVTDLGVVASYGPILAANGSDDDTQTLSGHFRTSIGQEIIFDHGVAVAVASDAPGQAQADAYHEIRIQEQELSACPAGPFGLSLEIAGSGSVDIDPDQAEYFQGDQITLTASPEAGWEFIRWEGQFEEVLPRGEAPGSTSNPLTVLVDDQDLIIDAIFEPAGLPAPAPLAVPVNQFSWLMMLGLMLLLAGGLALRSPEKIQHRP